MKTLLPLVLAPSTLAWDAAALPAVPSSGNSTDCNKCCVALTSACGAACHDMPCAFKCATCAGDHQQQLHQAGCGNDDIVAWCSGQAPPAPLPHIPPGYASAYTLSGCSSPADCGVYSLVSAHCTTSSSHCPGGGNANGNTDPALCDGVPTYQSADGTRVLLRYYDDGTDDIGDSTVWLVADSGTLNTCYGGHYYLDSAHIDGRVGSAPTAPGYSDGNGWFDLNNRRNDGNIRVTAGGGH